MAEVYADYGYESSFQSALGTSYAKSMKHFVSFGPVFQTEPSCAHMEDERMSITAMITATQIYTTYIATMASPIGGIRKKCGEDDQLGESIVPTEPVYRSAIPLRRTGTGGTDWHESNDSLSKPVHFGEGRTFTERSDDKGLFLRPTGRKDGGKSK